MLTIRQAVKSTGLCPSSIALTSARVARASRRPGKRAKVASTPSRIKGLSGPLNHASSGVAKPSLSRRVQNRRAAARPSWRAAARAWCRRRRSCARCRAPARTRPADDRGTARAPRSSAPSSCGPPNAAASGGWPRRSGTTQSVATSITCGRPLMALASSSAPWSGAERSRTPRTEASRAAGAVAAPPEGLREARRQGDRGEPRQLIDDAAAVSTDPLRHRARERRQPALRGATSGRCQA